MTNHRVLWTDAAKRDLEEIVAFIAADSSASALDVLTRIESRCSTLASLPDRGRIVPELRSIDVYTYRELIHGTWRIVYRREERRVFVIAVLDAHRNLSSLLLQRLTR